MTHTLHRKGTEENLSNDFIFLCMAAKGLNEDGSEEKLRDFLRIVLRHNPVNVGDMRTGSMYDANIEDILANVTSTSIVHGVFTDQDTVNNVLLELKEAGLGMSVVVSGPFNRVNECCQRTDLHPHSIDYSGGIWGKSEKLPSQEILEVTTMCGHAMVASGLVKALVQDIKAGAISPEKAGKELAKECACGIFNPLRATKLLEEMAVK
ncbi:MAG: hypothetical protein PHN78_08705 [Dehalococcoidales bacterium]|nr:hypothetical protein [Dehalococcoidales bacterium]